MTQHLIVQETEAARTKTDECDTLQPSLYRHTLTFQHNCPDGELEEVTVHFRPLRVEDEPLLRDFFLSHSDETIYLRYGMLIREMTHERALQLLELDGRNDFALAGFVDEDGAPRIIAIGRYSVDPETRLAEVAFVVHENYRHMGIATHVLFCLSSIIHQGGFAGICAQVFCMNTPMLRAMDEALGPAHVVDSCFGETTLQWRYTA